MVDEALNHPNWDMGRKITIDSATMMNKGFEVIEAFWLFGFTPDRIKIIVHPQSIIHSMIEMKDGAIKAQMGVPDMKVPIQYALTYPRHLEAPWEQLDFLKCGDLTFEKLNFERFPCLKFGQRLFRISFLKWRDQIHGYSKNHRILYETS
jgi:1-deoxy-D-xylulose-5-phosphate reductoisomerase